MGLQSPFGPLSPTLPVAQRSAALHTACMPNVPAETSQRAIDERARTVELAFASEAAVERSWGIEVLDCGQRSIRLDRMAAGANLLCDHDMRDVVGVVESVTVGSDRVVRAVVRFGRSPRAEEIWQDVRDGIRRNVSFGYLIHRAELVESKSAQDTFRVVDWEPFEVSLVSIPDDPTVGIGRALDTAQRLPGLPLSPGRAQFAPGVLESIERARASRRQLAADQLLVQRAVDAAMRAERQEMARSLSALESQSPSQAHPTMQMQLNPAINTPHGPVYDISGSDVRRIAAAMGEFSIQRAVSRLMNGERLDGIEADVTEAFMSRAGHGRAANLVLPWAVLAGASERGLSVSNVSAGAALAASVAARNAPAALQPYSFAARAGMQIEAGLTEGKTGLLSIAEDIDFHWLENEFDNSAPPDTPTIGVAWARPHLAIGLVKFSDLLVRLTGGAVEPMLRRVFLSSAGRLIDRMVLRGREADPAEPMGLLTTAGIQRLTASLAAGDDIAKVNEAMRLTCTRLGDDEGAAFVLGPTARSRLLAKDAADRGAMRDGRLQGRTTHTTAAMLDNGLVYGKWATSTLALYGPGIEIAVDPFTGFKSNTIAMRCMVAMDVAHGPLDSFTAVTFGA